MIFSFVALITFKNLVSYIYLLPLPQESEMETEEEVDILMSSDIYSATLSTKSISFTRAQTGWLFREDKTVCANRDFYTLKTVQYLILPK